jgi:hypothetical protein
LRILRARLHLRKERERMIGLLIGFLAEVVFDSAASLGRSYEAEVDRYLRERRLVPRTLERRRVTG